MNGGVNIALHTPLAGFANELCDVLKLFFAVEQFSVNAEEAGAAEPLEHRYTEEDGLAQCSFRFRGQCCERKTALTITASQPHAEVALKRLRKRLCKLALYDLLKALTGEHPPWGSLTGIRPTRLVYEKMTHGMTPQAGAEALEKEFDVTHEKAELLAQIVQVQSTLPPPDVKEADVYVSIPFCRTRCAYCSFPGEAVGRGTLIAPYLEALFCEMEAGAALLKRCGLTLRALYVGGGTPSALGEADFARLMDTVMRLFPNAREYTVEAGRPDTITRGKLETLKHLQIGRISINPQTMNDETLRVIGRDHSAQQTIEAFLLAREMGFSDINMDVIAGLPGENAGHFEHTMAEIERLKPDSLTVHTLAIKRSSRLNLEHAPLPDDAAAAHMVRLGEQTAQALHMRPYYLYRQKYMAGHQQNVGYAAAGAACLYNVDIMEETTSILAMGAGAISKRVFPDRELRIVRAPNVSNVAVYIERVLEMAQRKEQLFKK
ncbi:MAG: coproporphyrinogen dehydrogenase HemZ [Clostridia bacterium]